MLGLLGLGAAATAGWLVSRGHRDPRTWPQALAVEAVGLRDSAREALDAGRRAAKDRESEFEEEMSRASEAPRSRA